MDISVKLFGGLRSYLPPGSTFNAHTLSIDDNASLLSLLQKIPIPEDKQYLVIINDKKVHSENYAGIRINPMDDIVLLPPIKGG